MTSELLQQSADAAVVTWPHRWAVLHDIPQRFVTMKTATLCMMAAVGELASLAAMDRLPSRYGLEHEAVARILGKLATSLAVIGKCCEVDVEEARTRCVPGQKQRQKGGSAVHDNPPASAPHCHPQEDMHEGSEQPVIATLALPVSQPEARSDVLLSTMLSSPSSRRTAGHVDCEATLSKEAADQARLCWLAARRDEAKKTLTKHDADVGATCTDLCTEGCHIQHCRDVPPPLSVAPCPAVATLVLPSQTATTRSSCTEMHHNMSPTTASSTPSTQRQKFACDAVSAETKRVREGGIDGDDDEGRFERGSGVRTAGKRTYGSDLARLFYNSVEQVRRGEVSERQLAEFGLSFAVPDDSGRFVDLVHDGAHIAVTPANVETFLRLIERHTTSHASSGHTLSSRNVKRLEVVNELGEERSDFSPCHFAYGLFAPYQPSSAIYVDYDETEKILPPALRATERPARRLCEMPHIATSSSPYLQAIRHGDMAALTHIIRDVQRDVRALERYGVTYAVPSRLEPYATVEERVSGLHAIFPGSTYIRVEASDQRRFLALLRPYFKGLID